MVPRSVSARTPYSSRGTVVPRSDPARTNNSSWGSMVPRSVSARANIISGGSIVPRSMQARFDDSSGDAAVSESLTPGDNRSGGGDTLATPCRSHGSGAPIDATRGTAVSEAPVGQTPDRSGIGGPGHASAEAGSLEIDKKDRPRSTAFPLRLWCGFSFCERQNA